MIRTEQLVNGPFEVWANTKGCYRITCLKGKESWTAEFHFYELVENKWLTLLSCEGPTRERAIELLEDFAESITRSHSVLSGHFQSPFWKGVLFGVMTAVGSLAAYLLLSLWV